MSPIRLVSFTRDLRIERSNEIFLAPSNPRYITRFVLARCGFYIFYVSYTKRKSLLSTARARATRAKKRLFLERDERGFCLARFRHRAIIEYKRLKEARFADILFFEVTFDSAVR